MWTGRKQEFSHLAEIRNPTCSTEEDLIREIKGVHLLIADVDIQVTQKVLDAADRLRAVVCSSTGIDFLDLPVATRKGILVTNLPDYCAEAVVEHALGLLFCLCRPIVRGVRATFEGNWEERGHLQGIEVEGKTLGIIGLGRIGKRMAEKASGLGMKVIFYDPFCFQGRCERERLRKGRDGFGSREAFRFCLNPCLAHL